jgi:acetaldehyde dehydrogenase
MRDTIYARARGAGAWAVRASVERMSTELRSYVPGFQLLLCEVEGDLVTVMSEIEGAGDFLPAYADNLDIMTAAATRVGDEIAGRLLARRLAA